MVRGAAGRYVSICLLASLPPEIVIAASSRKQSYGSGDLSAQAGVLFRTAYPVPVGIGGWASATDPSQGEMVQVLFGLLVYAAIR